MDRIKQRYKAFWELENETPILLLKGQKHPPKLPTDIKTMDEKWCDIDYVVRKERAIFESKVFLGDSLPLINPDLGPDIFGASLGADLIFHETTSYSVPFIQDLTEEVDNIKFDENNKWWKLICDITKAFCEDSKGDYLVGIADLHAGGDGLVSLRGPQELCYDVFDCPEDIIKVAI